MAESCHRHWARSDHRILCRTQSPRRAPAAGPGSLAGPGERRELRKTVTGEAPRVRRRPGRTPPAAGGTVTRDRGPAWPPGTAAACVRQCVTAAFNLANLCQ
eukprot:10596-Hanusia_phi.AAC.1